MSQVIEPMDVMEGEGKIAPSIVRVKKSTLYILGAGAVIAVVAVFLITFFAKSCTTTTTNDCEQFDTASKCSDEYCRNPLVLNGEIINFIHVFILHNHNMS